MAQLGEGHVHAGPASRGHEVGQGVDPRLRLPSARARLTSRTSQGAENRAAMSLNPWRQGAPK